MALFLFGFILGLAVGGGAVYIFGALGSKAVEKVNKL